MKVYKVELDPGILISHSVYAEWLAESEEEAIDWLLKYVNGACYKHGDKLESREPYCRSELVDIAEKMYYIRLYNDNNIIHLNGCFYKQEHQTDSGTDPGTWMGGSSWTSATVKRKKIEGEELEHIKRELQSIIDKL